MERRLVIFMSGVVLSLSIPISAVPQQHHMKGMHGHMKQFERMPSKYIVQPAEGPSVNIISPKAGEVIKGDEISVHLKLIKGKRGEHVHVYVDGDLMGMFKSERGTLTGIQPGHRTLEVRVVAKDHVTELDATDKVHFVVK